MNLSDKALLEISELSFKAENLAKGGASDRQQSAVLLQRIANIRSAGLSSDEMRGHYGNALREETSPNVRTILSSAEYRVAFQKMLLGDDHHIQKLVAEKRDFLAGQQSIFYTQGVGGGYTLPVITEDKNEDIRESILATDDIFEASDFKMSDGPYLNPTVITGWDLSAVTTTNVAEGAQFGPVGTPAATARTLRSNNIHRWTVAASTEAIQDHFGDFMAKFQRAASWAIARGTGKEIMLGNGTNQAYGLFPQLGPAVANIGTAGGIGYQNAGTITYSDIATVYFALNAAYRKTAVFLCEDAVLQRLRLATDNAGRSLLSVHDDDMTLMGRPIKICPSLTSGTFSSLSFGALVFGDVKNHFVIRMSRPQVIRKTNFPYSIGAAQATVGDVTRGECLLSVIVRFDSVLIEANQGSAPSTIWAAVHS